LFFEMLFSFLHAHSQIFCPFPSHLLFRLLISLEQKPERKREEDIMQQQGQERQKRTRKKRTTEQPEPEDKQNLTTDSVQTEQQLTAAQQKAEEYLDLLRRTQADFINYRHRTSKEQAEERFAAQKELLSQLLPVLDDLGRALEAVPPELATHPWVLGISMIARRFTALLDQLGMQQIGEPGEPFDPHWHEAIATEAQPNVPEGTILHVIKPGYVLKDRIVRPAQVIVAGPSSP
jgi:molecular chaperone GrpE